MSKTYFLAIIVISLFIHVSISINVIKREGGNQVMGHLTDITISSSDNNNNKSLWLKFKSDDSFIMNSIDVWMGTSISLLDKGLFNINMKKFTHKDFFGNHYDEQYSLEMEAVYHGEIVNCTEKITPLYFIIKTTSEDVHHHEIVGWAQGNRIPWCLFSPARMFILDLELGC